MPDEKNSGEVVESYISTSGGDSPGISDIYTTVRLKQKAGQKNKSARFMDTIQVLKCCGEVTLTAGNG